MKMNKVRVRHGNRLTSNGEDTKPQSFFESSAASAKATGLILCWRKALIIFPHGGPNPEL
jgi:hypothetical protein